MTNSRRLGGNQRQEAEPGPAPYVRLGGAFKAPPFEEEGFVFDDLSLCQKLALARGIEFLMALSHDQEEHHHAMQSLAAVCMC